jgi:hypothetical protein
LACVALAFEALVRRVAALADLRAVVLRAALARGFGEVVLAVGICEAVSCFFLAACEGRTWLGLFVLPTWSVRRTSVCNPAREDRYT